MPHRFPPLRPPAPAKRKAPGLVQTLSPLSTVDLCLIAVLAVYLVVLIV